METRANYVLIGAFALGGFLGLLGFLLWFAQVQIDQQFDYYDVRFNSVSGLSRASDVRFAGLPVGQVVSVELSPEQDGTVRVRLEVAGNTPVRTDSIATIESMGVTGVSFVSISAGDPGSPLLRDPNGIPEIEAGRSALQSLTEDAPKIIDEAVKVMENLSELFDDANQQKVQTILDNLARSSGELSAALGEFSGVSRTVGEASEDIAAFAKRLDPVVAGVETTLGNVDTTLEAFTSLSGRIETSLDEADAALDSGRVALDAAASFMTGELPAISQDLTETTAFLRDQTETLVTDARGMIGDFSETGRTATARLTEAETTLAATQDAVERLSGTLDTVDAAAASFEGLMSNDGTALIADTRAMIANADTTMDAVTALSGRIETSLDETDAALESGRVALDAAASFMTGELPAISQDLTATTAFLRDQTETLVTDARGMIGDFSETGRTATARLTEAEATLAATQDAVERLTATLDTIDAAAASLDGFVTNDGTALVADTRAMIANADTAIASVTRVAETDLPAIVADIRSATETVTRVVAEVGTDLTDATGRFDGLADDAAGAMTQVTETFANANTTLAAIDSALVTGERSLAAAERVFDGADRVINEDVGAITADLRQVMERLDGTIATVSDDIPAITADLRDAADTANRAFAQLGQLVADSSPAVRDFASSGLQQYTQLARETRNLISNLEGLARQIERDPARFFLNRQTPEFRR